MISKQLNENHSSNLNDASLAQGMYTRKRSNNGSTYHIVTTFKSSVSFNVYIVFLDGPTPASFSFIFGPFQTNNTIFTTNICEKCPSSIQCRDLNPQPSEGESLPITT